MNFDKYPRTKKLLEQYPGMSLDQALVFTENELNKLKKEESHDPLSVPHQSRGLSPRGERS